MFIVVNYIFLIAKFIIAKFLSCPSTALGFSEREIKLSKK